MMRHLARALVLLVLAAPCAAPAKEAFRGETALLRSLGAEERLAYFGAQYLMNDQQKRQYLSLPTAEERAAWFDRFWIDLDPTPATPENERRAEHERRVALARRLFGMKKAPGWDRRGETLIRWGLPTDRARTFGNIGFYEFTPPGEVWYYHSLDMIVQFSDFNLKGEFFYASDPVGRSSRRDIERNKNVSDLLKYGVIQQLYPINYLSPDEVKDLADYNPDDIDYIADSEVRMMTLKDRIAAIEAEKIQEKVNNFYRYRVERPTLYSFEIDQRPLPLWFDVTPFDGGAGTIRTEIGFEVPAAEVQFVRREGSMAAEIELAVLVRDLENREVAAAVDVLRPSSTGNTYDGPSLLPGQVVLGLPPGYYRIGVEARDLLSKRRAAYRTNVELPAFSDAPAISGVQFASGIGETDGSGRFRKGALQVVPHPLRAYRAPVPLSVYFEVYGLDTDPEGLAYYRIEYRIDPVGKRRAGAVLAEEPAISSSFETSGYGATQPQHLSIATANLSEGRFRLTVTVTDRRTFRAAERTEYFAILK